MCNVSDHEPWWLTLAPIVGFEDDDDSSDDDDDDSSDDDEEEESEEDESDESEESDEEDEDKPVTQKDIKNLKSALQKERKARKIAERDLRKARAAAKKPPPKASDNGDADKGDKEEEDKGPSEREIRLAARLRDQAVDAVITKVASRMNFVDMEDVLRLVNRSEFDINQDEEDPTDVIIDEDGVEDALKALAKKKKYLVATDGDKPKSGSKMSGKGKKSKGADEEALRQKYRALRR